MKSDLRCPLLCASIVLALAACERSGPALVPLHRLVDLQPRAVARGPLAAGRHVAIDDVARPVLAGSRPFDARPECGAGAAPSPCSVAVPAELASSAWLLIDVATRPSRAPSGDSPGKRPPLLLPQHGAGTVALAGVDPRAVQRVEVRGVPPLAERDVTTAAVEIARGARLRFAVGVEDAVWEVDAAPVEVAVAALASGETHELFRRRLDPARDADDRRWIEADVALDELAGREARLRFLARPATEGDARPSLPVFADPTIWAPAGADAKPSVVLISLDTLRARSMSLYGHTLPTTPFLDRFAATGATVERAFTTFSNTLGSHMSMLTGLYPASHGVVALNRRLAPEHATLAERLRAAGWDTAAFTEDGLLAADLGFRRGFGVYWENKTVGSAAGDARGTFRRALDWAGSREGTPFFLFVHTYAVHIPYAPPPEYRRMLIGDGGSESDLPPVERERLRYEQEVRALDDDVRRFLERLEEIVPAERLLVVVTSDHGEEFGEHGLITHLQLYDEVLHVPLLLRWRGRIAPGVRVAAPASLVDVVPTVLELLSVEPRAADGASLAPLLRDPRAALPRRAVFAQVLPREANGRDWFFIARSADEKCMLPIDGAGRCFDLARDPREQQPLSPEQSPALGELHGLADEYRARALVAIGPGALPMSEAALEVDRATQLKLQALGYLD
ncbi:MAG: sulfatase [Thermodesulfobacteriota bacterium]